MRIRIFALLLTSLVCFTACDKEDPTPPPKPTGYEEGVFVLNEGNFGSGNASLTFINAGGEVEQQVFQNQNGAKLLGDTATDMGFFEEYAFIVLNASNSIVVVDREDFQEVATLTEGVSNPRKIAFSKGKAFVTNWGVGSDPEDDFVAVYDAQDLTLLEQISVAEGPDEILSEENQLYVAHSGGWSFNNTISVIGVDSHELLESVEVGDVPNSMQIFNGDLWVLSAGLPSYTGQESAGMISRIDLTDLEVVEELEFSQPTEHPSHLRTDGTELYYVLGGQVFSFNPGLGVLPETPILVPEEADYLYGFEIHQGNAFITSANSDFTGNGTLLIYELPQGNLTQTYTTGINPNGVFFN